MRSNEQLPSERCSKWDDAWEVSGKDGAVAGTWCPPQMETTHPRVQEWRFDRMFYLTQWVSRVDAEPQNLTRVRGKQPVQIQSGSKQTVQLVSESFERTWGVALSDHACISGTFHVLSGSITDKLPAAEYLTVIRPGLGSNVAKRPAESESCSQKTQTVFFCGKDFEKPRMQPGTGLILEDSRRKGLYRLYTRRNCHHVNTHDPLKAIGLVANVDDQVVLTIQAAINYLTKYMGKLGSGHTATSRIGGLLDDILCRMQDHETMTVTSLLSKLFIHTAVPDQICSLEAWHVLFDLPRTLCSRIVVGLSAKDERPVLKDLDTIQRGTEHDTVTKQTKLMTYAKRLEKASFGGTLTNDDVTKMSLAQFVSRVDCRGKKMSWRKKAAIVKEKPYLNLDAKRVNAGDMARYALRLHSRFVGVAQDPARLSNKEALEQLETFVQSKQCPVWLKKRYNKQNKETRKSKKRSASEAVGVSEDAVLLPVPRESGPSDDAVLLPVSHDNEPDAAPPPLPPPDAPPPRSTGISVLLEDNDTNRKKIAEEHGFPWDDRTVGEMRFSVAQACRDQRPVPKRLQMKKYLDALSGEEKPRSEGVVVLMQQFVFRMLAYDLVPYTKRGGGLVKAGLQKTALVQVLTVHFENLGSENRPTQKVQRDLKKLPYPALWEEVKERTLRECGLTVLHGVRGRMLCTAGGSVNAPVKDGEWRSRVCCWSPWKLAEEEVEDPRERLAKRTRYVAGATQEQSMGPPGKELQEVQLPVDVEALTGRDKETAAEWDALNPYLKWLSTSALSDELTADVVSEVAAWTKQKGSDLSYVESLGLVRPVAAQNGPVSVDDLDPTQKSFVDHMAAFAEAFLAEPSCAKHNLPLPSSAGTVEAWNLGDPVLLLGTAGTGKTTTMQAANGILDNQGLGNRIVRAAYTGVAASNMGSGARTIVSLFRLQRKYGGGPLTPLSEEEMKAMANELGAMAVLELDEASMIEKLLLAEIHDRLKQWRFMCYHPHHCNRHQGCRCGANRPFGGVKVVLAGDFGQLPPVAVEDEKTLLNPFAYNKGRDSAAINLGGKLFRSISNVFRLRRIHRQAGASVYKESLLRLRDAAHTKEDVELWKTHDLASPTCTLTPEEIRKFENQRVHLFSEKKKAGQFNGRRLGEDAVDGSGILRIWSVDSTAEVERDLCAVYGGLRRVLHLSMGAPVMLISNLRTAWNLVNGLRGRIVALVWKDSSQGGGAASASTGGAAANPPVRRNAAEVGGVQATTIEYLVVDFPGYVGPCMIRGHPTYVCVAWRFNRHERKPQLSRTQFPVVLCYGMTVHKSQGLTLHEGCVFDMEHEPTWQPFRLCCGLAFVGASRVTDFEHMAFRHVPNYWTFREVADTQMFKWRTDLEKQLDQKHDATAKRQFFGKASLADDIARHVEWSENRKGGALTQAEVTDLVQMLSVGGVLQAPGYTDKPTRLPASKLGGGRNKRGTMRGSVDKTGDAAVAEPEVDEAEADEENYYRERMREDADFEMFRKELAEEERRQESGALHFTDYMTPEEIEEMLAEAEVERLRDQMHCDEL